MATAMRRPGTSVSAAEISALEICSALEADACAAIAAASQRVSVAAGGKIIGQDEASFDVYFMLSGRVRVNMLAGSGRQVTYQILAPGQIFGELAAIDGKPRSAAVSAEDDATLARVDDATFLRLLDQYPLFALRIMRRLTSLSRWLAERVYEYHTYDVRGRICSELLRFAQAPTGEPIALTDMDMASRVGTTRENVTRIYGVLRRRGLVIRTSNSIHVPDARALREFLAECEFG